MSSLLRKFGVADRRALAALAPSLVTTSGVEAGRLLGRPAVWTAFVGRARERSEVAAALGEARLVTLVGPGGVGKTRLAAVVAEEVAASLPLGGAFVELVAARTGFLVQAVAAVIGVTERPQQPLAVAVQEHLGRGRSLLVLDNCEHVLDEAAGLIEQLLAACPDLTVLATSRERLGISGERVVPLSGLSLVDATGGRAASDAEELFLERASAFGPGQDLDRAAVRELCARLDGIPLAIELAAARSASLGVGGLLVGVEDRLRLLIGGRGSDERHRSLRAVIDWSYELLDEDERWLFRQLGVFAGGFDLDAVGVITATSSVAVLTDLVGRLVDKSLVVHRRLAGGSRWSLLETVRAYALDRLAAGGEDAAVRQRHLIWAADTATELERRLVAGDEWQAGFDLVADDLRAALTTVPDGSAPDEDTHRLAHALGRLVFARRFLAEAGRHYQTAAEHAPADAIAAADLADALYVAQVEMRGDRAFELGLATARRAAAAGDRRAQAVALAGLVVTANRYPAMFGVDTPLDRLTQLIAEAERCAPPGDSFVAAHVAAARAWNEQRVDPTPDAVQSDAALDAAKRAGDPALVSGALDLVGSRLLKLGRFRDAHRLSLERVDLLDRLPAHDPRSGQEIVDTLHMANEQALTVGDLPSALAMARRFESDSAAGAIPLMVASKPLIALVLQGSFDDAIAKAGAVRSLWERAGKPPARWMAPPVYAVALAHGLRGDREAYAEWAGLAREIAGTPSRVVHINLTGFAQFADARIALHAGGIDDAVAAVADLPVGPDSWWETRHWHLNAYPWALAAEVAVVAGLPEAADRLTAARPAAEQSDWAAACLARVRGRLHADRDALVESIIGWERIGARFERACTLLLLDDRAADGRAELADLGCPLPADARP